MSTWDAFSLLVWKLQLCRVQVIILYIVFSRVNLNMPSTTAACANPSWDGLFVLWLACLSHSEPVRPLVGQSSLQNFMLPYIMVFSISSECLHGSLPEADLVCHKRSRVPSVFLPCPWTKDQRWSSVLPCLCHQNCWTGNSDTIIAGCWSLTASTLTASISFILWVLLVSRNMGICHWLSLSVNTSNRWMCSPTFFFYIWSEQATEIWLPKLPLPLSNLPLWKLSSCDFSLWILPSFVICGTTYCLLGLSKFRIVFCHWASTCKHDSLSIGFCVRVIIIILVSYMCNIIS